MARRTKHVHNVNGHLTRRIISIYRSATPAEVNQGLEWYEAAHTFALGLSERYDLKLGHAAGIIAALSPRLPWDLNMRAADQLCRTGDAPVLFDNKRKARAILHGADPDDVLGGFKVRNFWHCIEDPFFTDSVAVDRHAVDLAMGQAGDDKSRKFLEYALGYNIVADAYRSAARRADVRPLQMQAITWVAWRNKKRAGRKAA